MTVLEQATITVDYGTPCYGDCQEMCWRMHRKLNVPNYSRGVSLLKVPDTVGAWRQGHRTARKGADHALRLGYTFDIIDRSRFNDDIYDINISKPVRQGRPMDAGYTTRHNHGQLPKYQCDRHYVQTYGVLQQDTLRAYLALYRLGDLALVSMVLGHGDHEKYGIMYLLFQGVIEDQAGQGGWFYYNRHDSGTDGLRFKKERYGFYPRNVEWVLQ